MISVYSNVNDAHMVTVKYSAIWSDMQQIAASIDNALWCHVRKNLQFAVLRRAMTPELSLHGQHGSTTSHQGPTPGRTSVQLGEQKADDRRKIVKVKRPLFIYIYYIYKLYIYYIYISNAFLSVQDVAWCSVILSIAIIRSRSSRRSIMMISFFISFFIISSYRTSSV